MLPIVVDQVEQGVSRVIDNLVDKENYIKLLTLFLEEVQQLEDQNHLIARQKNLDAAEGVWLDYIGAIVGLPRAGRSDEDYRFAIRTKIGINTSDGTPNVIIDLIKQHTSATDVKLIDYYPAGFITTNNGTSGENSSLFELLEGVKPAGVSAEIIWNEGGTRFVPAWLNANSETTVDSGLLLDDDEHLILEDGSGVFEIVTGGSTEPLYLHNGEELEINPAGGSDEDDFLVVLVPPEDIYQNDITFSYLSWVGASSFEIVTGGSIESLDLHSGEELEITTSGSGGSDAGRLAQVITQQTISVV